MTSPLHAAVWLDHQEARVIHVALDGFDEKKIEAPDHHVHRHPRGASEAHQHPDDQRRFFDAIAAALAGAEQILILGPTTARLEFVHHLEAHHRPLAPKIVANETVDHPTDAQLVAYVKQYFHVGPLRVV